MPLVRAPGSGCGKTTCRNMSSRGCRLWSWRRRRKWGSGWLRRARPCGCCCSRSPGVWKHLALGKDCQINQRRRGDGVGGARSPLAAADRSIATKSVIPYLPSKYRIIVVSSMTLLLLSMVPRLGSVPFDYVQKDSGVEMRETCVGREKKSMFLRECQLKDVQ